MVCLVVPNGTHRPEALVDAIRTFQPGWDVEAVWAGDPQLHPVCGDLGLVAAGELVPSWESMLVARAGRAAEWIAGLALVSHHLRAGRSSVVLLWVGSVAVMGPLDPLVPEQGSAMFVPRFLDPAALDDGRWPDGAALAHRGSLCDVVGSFAAGSDAVVARLAARIAAGEPPARVLEQSSVLDHVVLCRDPRIGVGAWRWDVDAPSLLDLSGFDPARPWVLDPSIEQEARLEVASHADRSATLAEASMQVQGEVQRVRLPGGIAIDATVSSIVADALTDADAAQGTRVPLSPWSEAGAFRRWLAPRWWEALHAGRRDLAVAFPQPSTDDAAAWTRWMQRACIDDDAPLVVPPAAGTRAFRVADVLTPGIDVVGYLSRSSGVGIVAARLLDVLHGAGVPAGALDYVRSDSPVADGPSPAQQMVAHEATVAVVTADQFPVLRMDHPELFEATRRMVGYWFWELEHVPASMRAAMRLVDEIWVGSSFIANALGPVATVPVHHVPITVPEPVCSARERASFAPLADVGDRPVFGVVLDHFSVTARKNPIGAIDAFCRAFAPGEGPVLVVKTINGSHRWPQHQELIAAASGRDDIRIWDEHLSRLDQMAFVRSLDALVSLHRSEGLGLHLAEAMWLGTPVIATRYSGNLDLMDDASALLIDAAMVPVRDGAGVYPPEARWADPDLDAAAAAMRLLVDDREVRARLVAAAAARMASQVTPAQVAAQVVGLLGFRMAS